MTQSKLSFEDLLARLCERQAELPAEVQEACRCGLSTNRSVGSRTRWRGLTDYCLESATR